MGLHKLKKNFCMAKEAINKTKRQPIKWEKIFAKHIYEKGLLFKIHKEHKQLNYRKTNNLT